MVNGISQHHLNAHVSILVRTQKLGFNADMKKKCDLGLQRNIGPTTRAKINQVDATLFVEQRLGNVVFKVHATTLIEFTMLMRIVRSIVVRC